MPAASKYWTVVVQHDNERKPLGHHTLKELKDVLPAYENVHGLDNVAFVALYHDMHLDGCALPTGAGLWYIRTVNHA